MLITKISFFVYALVLLVIGIMAYRFTYDKEGYFLGGRRLGPFTAALSAGASDMSGWLLLGLPGAVFLSGVNQVWIAIGLLVGSFLCWITVASRLRSYTASVGAVTLAEYLGRRFRDTSRMLQLFTALITLVFFTFYTSSGLVASGLLLEEVLGLDYKIALLLGLAVILVYTFMGGFLAVSWTDVLQGILMFFALIIVPILCLTQLGGVDNLVKEVSDKKGFLDIFSNTTLIGAISLMAWGLGYFGQPHILVRFMGMKSISKVPYAVGISFFWTSITLVCSIAVGVLGYAYVSAKGVSISDPETIFLVLVKELSNPWVGGILLAAVLSAVLSTIDSQLLVSASAVSDLVGLLGRRREAVSEKVCLEAGRYSVLLILLVAYLLAISPGNTVLGLVSYAWAGFGAAFGPVIILSIFWKRMNRNGALAGIISGALFVLICGSGGQLLQAIGMFDAFPTLNAVFKGGVFGIYELLPGFIFSGMVAVIATLSSKEPTKVIQKEFETSIRSQD